MSNETETTANLTCLRVRAGEYLVRADCGATSITGVVTKRRAFTGRYAGWCVNMGPSHGGRSVPTLAAAKQLVAEKAELYERTMRFYAEGGG